MSGTRFDALRTADSLGAEAARTASRDAPPANPYRDSDPVLARFWRRGYDTALAQRVAATHAEQ